MLMRKIRKSHISVTGYFSSYKNKRQINFESKLEHDFYLLLEFDETIKSYQEQPFKVYYIFQDKKRRYTPDTLVNYTNDTQKVFEVKPIFSIKTAKLCNPITRRLNGTMPHKSKCYES